MKIVGYTQSGYLIELSPEEISKLTGNNSDCRDVSRNYRQHPENANLEIGTEFPINENWSLIKKLNQNEQTRKQIAESLRAAATLVESIPSALVAPVKETQTLE